MQGSEGARPCPVAQWPWRTEGNCTHEVLLVAILAARSARSGGVRVPSTSLSCRPWGAAAAPVSMPRAFAGAEPLRCAAAGRRGDDRQYHAAAAPAAAVAAAAASSEARYCLLAAEPLACCCLSAMGGAVDAEAAQIRLQLASCGVHDA